VRVQPRASRRGVTGVLGGELKLAVASPPADGRATQEARRALAEWLGLPASRVTLASGAASRSKRFLVAGIASGALRTLIAERLASPGGRGP